MAKFGIASNGAPPEVVAKVVRWLLTNERAGEYCGLNVEAQWFCHDHDLLEGWEGPTRADNKIRYDQSAANLIAFEARWPDAVPEPPRSPISAEAGLR
jgi:hypothetical protein